MTKSSGKFTYVTKMDSGYNMKMSGAVFGSPHHVVITAALDHQLTDNVVLLDAAPLLLDALRGFQSLGWLNDHSCMTPEGLSAVYKAREVLALCDEAQP